MFDFTHRSRAVWGGGVDRLAGAHVAVAGLGGVGAMAAEALCRAGIGRLTLIDSDVYELSNLNRQLFSLRETLGENKAAAAKKRLMSINPDCEIKAVTALICEESIPMLLCARPDFVIDAIDTVTHKLSLIEFCINENIPIISSMGAGNRSDPTAIRLGDIADTAGCGCALSRVMRRELRRKGIERLAVSYSAEAPVSAIIKTDKAGRHSPGSTPFVPMAAGLALGYYVAEEIMK